MTEVQISKHYNDEVTIKFYPVKHAYQLEGQKNYLVGVTTATGMVDKSGPLLIWSERLTREFLLKAIEAGKQIDEHLIEEAVKQHCIKKEAAATIGTMVHEWAGQYILGNKPATPEDPNVKMGVMAFLRWINENGVKFVESEKVVYSRKYNYVGTMDVIFTMASEDHKIMHVGDFKTASGIYMEMVMQTSAYQHAYTEEFGTEFGDKYILRFDKTTGQFESKCFPKEEHESHFDGFIACLQLKELNKVWEKEHGYYSKK